MIGRILSRSFWSWWDNLSYSMFTALVAALNPSFLVLVPTVAFLLTSEIGFVKQYADFWIIIGCTTVAGIWLWPLSVVSHRMHEEMTNGPVVGYFKKLWQFIREHFWSSLGFWVVATGIGFLFGLSFVFYARQMASFSPLWAIVFFVSLWFFVLFMMMEMVLVVLLYKSGMKVGEMLLLAFYTVIRYAFVYFVVFLISWVLYGILLVPAATPFLPTPGIMPLFVIIPLVSVYGLGPTLHIWTFRYVFDEAPPEEKKRSIWELFLPIVHLWRWLLRLVRGGRR